MRANMPPYDPRYPDSDRKPMADNTVHYDYLTTIKENLEVLLHGESNVFIAGNLFWYPVEGRPDIRFAPDVMVAFGRPKGHRWCYKQWEEGGVAPQFVFEIFTDVTPPGEIEERRIGYDRYGVTEYYEYDSHHLTLTAWLRDGATLQSRIIETSWRSPLLGITLQLEKDGELSVFYPNGNEFISPVEMMSRNMERQKEIAAINARIAEAEALIERRAAKLRELGIDTEGTE